MKPMKTINLTDEQYQALIDGESVTITPPAKKWNPCKGNWYVQPMCYREENAHKLCKLLNSGEVVL